MERNEIIRMARDAGISRVSEHMPVCCSFDRFERFATLVASAEREECAKMFEGGFGDMASLVAEEIRARIKK